MADHVRAMLRLKEMGSYVFDYGNNLRAGAQNAGVDNAFDFPGFVPAYIRLLFWKAKGHSVGLHCQEILKTFTKPIR